CFFQIHRGSAVIAWFITAASFVIIFVKVKGLSTTAEIHAYLGIALMSACTLQIVCGVAHPDLKSRLRPIFNWGHWFLGKSCHLLA
ncbi:FRRS1-like protein, partial [Mya arenaria]